MFTIVAVMICIVLAIFCLSIYLKNRKLRQQLKYLKPMIEAVENVRDIIYYCEVKPTLKYLYLSESINHFLGLGSKKMHMSDPMKYYDILHPDDKEIGEKKQNGELDYSKLIQIRLRNKDGEYIWFEEFVTPIYRNGNLKAVVGICRNVQEKVALQKQLEIKAHYDTMTGVYNREYFQLKMNEYDKNNYQIGVLVADLDGLKWMNDHHGHQKGDILILEAAKLFNQLSSDHVIVSRIGGDEFTLLVTDLTERQVQQMKDSLFNMIAIYNESAEFPVNVSIGLAYSETSKGKMEQLFAEADFAMYEQKKLNKSKVYSN